MRIGIFGGSFNPIHVGHIALAKQLRQQAHLDEVWLMVSPQNPLKQQTAMLDDQLRYQLARIALHNEEGIKACNIELRLPRPSYTWNTLQQLSTSYPIHHFMLMIGGDNWLTFPHWYRADDILRHYDIVVYPRAGSTIDCHTLPTNVMLVDMPLLNISSTEVRQRIAQGLSIEGMVPRAIIPLVNHLYPK